MKILLVQNTDYIKRNPAQQHHLMEMMSLRGHEIRVIDFELLWREDKEKQFRSKRKVFENVSKIHKNAQVTVIRPGIIKLPLLDYISLFYGQINEIEHQIKEFKPDVIVSLGIVSYIAGKAAVKHNIPFVYYWIDVSHRLIPFKFLQPIGIILEKKALKMPNKVLTINKRLENYVKKLGVNTGITDVLGAGIELERFDHNIKGDHIRKEYGIGQDDFVLFFMGWLYNFSGLIEVATELSKNKNPEVKLLVVGDGDAYEKLQNIKKNHNLINSLILTGKQPYEKIPEFISAANICILPAYTDEKIMQEIVPIKIYEYLAMSKPVITTELPGVMLEFSHKNGISYVKRPEDVVRKAYELKNNNELSIEGKRARNFAVDRKWENIADKFENILKEVI